MEEAEVEGGHGMEGLRDGGVQPEPPAVIQCLLRSPAPARAGDVNVGSYENCRNAIQTLAISSNSRTGAQEQLSGLGVLPLAT